MTTPSSSTALEPMRPTSRQQCGPPHTDSGASTLGIAPCRPDDRDMGPSAAVARARDTTLADRLGSPATSLFLGLFASQAGVLVLSPILVDVARDFGVSTALAGQLRLVAAPLAIVVAVGVARSAGRLPLRSVLAFGAALVFVGSLASAVAPSFALLALAQIPSWVGA